MPLLRNHFLFCLVLLIVLCNALYLLAETPSIASTKPIRMAKKSMHFSLPKHDLMRTKIQTYRSWISSRRMMGSRPRNNTLWIRLRNSTSAENAALEVQKATHALVELEY